MSSKATSAPILRRLAKRWRAHFRSSSSTTSTATTTDRSSRSAIARRCKGCGTIRVDTTAYYAIFDTELSESCDDQLDETGYLTVTNSCNSDGWAVERNAGDRFLVADSDNTGRGCTSDSECASDHICRAAGSHGRCCVPDAPVFMGTFLLVAGEDNTICINHWCPEWRVEDAAGRDFGFVEADCGPPAPVNSIHFRIDANAIACVDETTLQPCSWGCGMGGCVPDPCDAADCPRFCMDGTCLDTNPCDDVTCEHGCVRGRCLQNRHARGPDADGDGYSVVADCDDMDPFSHPGRREVCDDDRDNDCDGNFDEGGCAPATPGPDGGTGADTSTSMDGGTGPGRPTDGGCGCRVSARSAPSFASMTLALGLIFARRFTRR